MAKGTVKWFNESKGFGFITQDINFNHPLAGKTLNFEVEIIEIKQVA